MAAMVIQVLVLLSAFLVGAALGRRIFARKDSGPARDPAADVRIPARSSRAAETGRLVFGHEMKNYLCVLKGNARLLRLGAKSEEDRAAIVDRIDRVVERLEAFAWKEQPGPPDLLRSGRRECVDLLETARNCSRIHFSPTGAEFSVSASGGFSCVHGDPHRLEQVLMNLYGNALEAGARRVKTRIRRIGAEVEVAVEDDGRGCAPEQAVRIFQPFRLPQAAAKADFRGDSARGLGLSIVRSIVENHGGRMRADAKNGRGDGETGLVVYLHFPVCAPAPPRLPHRGSRGDVGFPTRRNPSWDPWTETAGPPL